jgi:hypothetical protein
MGGIVTRKGRVQGIRRSERTCSPGPREEQIEDCGVVQIHTFMVLVGASTD